MIRIRKYQSTDIDALVNLFDPYRVFYEKDSDKVSAKIFYRNGFQIMNP
jgi:sRNA-binding regulator protein Hfq